MNTSQEEDTSRLSVVVNNKEVEIGSVPTLPQQSKLMLTGQLGSSNIFSQTLRSFQSQRASANEELGKLRQKQLLSQTVRDSSQLSIHHHNTMRQS